MTRKGDKPPPSRSRTRRSTRILLGLVLTLALGLVTLQLVAVPYRIRGRSMEPTLLGDTDGTQDIVLVNRLAYALGTPARWDIVVLCPPDADEDRPPTESVKRIVGLPGEVLEIRNGDLYVNDDVLRRPDSDDGQGTVRKGPYGHRRVKLGAREYFVLGDNSYLSLDSRAYGPIDREALLGRVELIVLPWARWGRPR
jgi:signal peptidase I